MQGPSREVRGQLDLSTRDFSYPWCLALALHISIQPELCKAVFSYQYWISCKKKLMHQENFTDLRSYLEYLAKYSK